MEITIEETIDVLEYLKTQNSQLLSLDVALETMRKYQKIAEIADEWEHDHDNLNYADDSYYWSKVREVIEDGKNDR